MAMSDTEHTPAEMECAVCGADLAGWVATDRGIAASLNPDLVRIHYANEHPEVDLDIDTDWGDDD